METERGHDAVGIFIEWIEDLGFELFPIGKPCLHGHQGRTLVARQAAVIDQGSRMNFPSRHPLNQSQRSGAVIREADVIVGLEGHRKEQEAGVSTAVNALALLGRLGDQVGDRRVNGRKHVLTLASYRIRAKRP